MMKSTFKFAAIAASAMLLAGASAASANVLVATWTGTVSDGYDSTGVFGSVGSLDGDTYVAKYTYNTSVGLRETDLPYYDEVYGGSTYGSVGPDASPVSATITINGHTATSNGEYQGTAITEPYYSYWLEQVAEQDNETGYSVIVNQAYYGDQVTLETSVPLTDVSYDSDGFFQIEINDDADIYTSEAYANLSPETLQIGSAVPEPAAWALMLSGLGFIGAGIRARRRAAALA
jgi:hypothetical protein